jgi:DNA phosphorothioation-associated putative methyltransferase
VIEDTTERQETLCAAFGLAKRVLVVSVRVDRSLAAGAEYSDGLVTNTGSFQKIYTQSEFKEYLQAVLGRKPYMASLGIAYVFKDESFEAEHLARLSITPPRRAHVDLFTQFAQDPQGREFVDLTQELGRPPLPSEFDRYSELLARFGSRARIERLVLHLLEPESMAGAQAAKKGDILRYLSMLRLRGLRPPRFRLLPPETQADIKLFWPSYKGAIEEGEQFLFQLGNSRLVREACLSAPVGKRLPTDVYLHRSAEETLPALLRVLIFAALQVVGEVGYNVVKLSIDGRNVSFLNYKDFDDVAHPELLHSVRVHLPSASYTIRDYSSSENPPILHRKDSFVDPLHPGYGAFAELTRQEDELGLLSRSDVGFKSEWLRILDERGLQIVGHDLHKRGCDTDVESEFQPD